MRNGKKKKNSDTLRQIGKAITTKYKNRRLSKRIIKIEKRVLRD